MSDYNRWYIDEQRPDDKEPAWMPMVGIAMAIVGVLALLVGGSWAVLDTLKRPIVQPEPPPVIPVEPPDPEPEEEPPRTLDEIADDADRDGATFLTPREHALVVIESRRQMRLRIPDDLVPELEDDGYFYWTYGGQRYRWHTLKEGRTYGGRFKYRNGVMEIVR